METTQRTEIWDLIGILNEWINRDRSVLEFRDLVNALELSNMFCRTCDTATIEHKLLANGIDEMLCVAEALKMGRWKIAINVDQTLKSRIDNLVARFPIPE